MNKKALGITVIILLVTIIIIQIVMFAGIIHYIKYEQEMVYEQLDYQRYK